MQQKVKSAPYKNLSICSIGFFLIASFVCGESQSAVKGSLITDGQTKLFDSHTELVQTVPVETTLAQPDLATTKETWIKMIKAAVHTIDVAQFYVAHKKDEPLDDVIAAIRSAAKRGVRVRFLISNELAKTYATTIKILKNFSGLELKILDLSDSTGGIIHAKYLLVDQRSAYLGSANFDWRALKHIHELGIFTTEPKVTESLSKLFEYDWQSVLAPGAPKPTHASSAPLTADHLFNGELPSTIRVVASPPTLLPKGINYSLPELLNLISVAKKSISIQLLNYTPIKKKNRWMDIDNALRNAAKSGVKVQLMVSHWGMALVNQSTGKTIPKSTRRKALEDLAKVKNIDVRFATIPEHSSGPIPFARVIHSKYMVIDDQALWLGTSNWSEDYFLYSRNVEIILPKPDLAKKATAIFNKLWNGSYITKL